MRVDRRTAPLLVLGGVVSVQFGGALAATLVPKIGAAGSVTLRLLFATLVLYAVARPSWRGRSRSAWVTVLLFGLALAAMNTAFYASLAHLPIGVAVTIEFLGPLTLAAVLSRRPTDFAAVAAAALGVALVSGAFDASWDRYDPIGIVFAAIAGAMWAAYIVLSQRTGRAFAGLDGLALALIVSTVAVAPFGLATVSEWTPAIIGLGLGIAMLSSVLPYSLELMALRHLSPRVFGVLLSLEPAVAALAGFLVLGQVLDLPQVAGMALVVAASAIVLGSPGRRITPPDPTVAPG
ncbi:membrane protein [Intrasporangium oryzae NRRL B-24470]|uniref:Membrane protein n=1 Tax=Intrasporangium oryzae NRRL B-24470 TaxID=1386089 RepID=W9GCB7_9MICO|nr:EamA family transporter [Intrasporangium oryzae]EWT02872.1 membrane protein [Intrasporangium oryzae NRRL B-24470]